MDAATKREMRWDQYIQSTTRLVVVPGCADIKLHLSPNMDMVWDGLVEMEGVPAGPPFWSVAWPGGRALAGYLLKRPGLVQGKSVLDLGAGSGICAISAAKSGARRVTANDTDPMAARAIALNASANQVPVTIEAGSLLDLDHPGADTVIAADLWYERHMAERATATLRRWRRQGVSVFLGDNRRAFFPKSGTHCLAAYDLDTVGEHEAGTNTRAFVWRLEK